MKLSEEIQTYDIAIVGGGMVGISLALLLANEKRDWRIALVESLPMPSKSDGKTLVHQPSFDARATAISLGSIQILENLGIWAELKKHHTAIKTVQVSDRGHIGGTEICAAQEQVDLLGSVLENAWIGKVLLAQLQQNPAIDLIAPAQVKSVQPKKSGAEIKLSLKDSDAEEQKIFCQLMVLADGGESALSKSLGLEYDVQDYSQSAIISNVEFESPHQGVAFERFTEQGPMALLPLGESSGSCRSALVWTVPSLELESIMAMPDEDFLARLQLQFGYRLGSFSRASKRSSYPLKLKVVKEQIRSNIVVMGNAAHYLHPVAGQGFNLALRDCAVLTEVISKAFRQKKNIGQLSVLQEYLRIQTLDQKITIGFSDTIVKLFSNKNLPLQAVRALGLLALDIMPEAKKFLSNQTMGLASRKPRLQKFDCDEALDAPLVDEAK